MSEIVTQFKVLERVECPITGKKIVICEINGKKFTIHQVDPARAQSAQEAGALNIEGD